MPEAISISEITHDKVLNLAGHDRGLAARARFEVDKLDSIDEPVDVLFPRDFRQVSSSFFQGMFAESVKRLGSVKGFFEHYRFDAPAHVRAKLADYADQVLARNPH